MVIVKEVVAVVLFEISTTVVLCRGSGPGPAGAGWLTAREVGSFPAFPVSSALSDKEIRLLQKEILFHTWN